MTAYGYPKVKPLSQDWQAAKEKRRKQLAAVRARRRIIYQRFFKQANKVI